MTDNTENSGSKYILDPLEDRIEEAIQTAAQAVGEPITGQEYQDWAESHPEDWPSQQTMANSEFGSWGAACEAAGVIYGRQEYTTEDIINALEDAVAALGEPLSGVQYDEWVEETDANHPVSATINNHEIGPFVVACEERGIETAAISPDGYSRSDMLDAIQQAAEAQGEPLSQTEYNKWRQNTSNEHPSRKTISTSQHFESWGEACESASVQYGTPDKKWQIQDLLNALQTAAEDVEGNLTTSEYETWQQSVSGDHPSSAVFRSDKYISWEEACQRAGVSSGKQLDETTPDRETVRNAIEQAATDCDEPLSKLEYQRWRSDTTDTQPTVEAIVSVFGTWTTGCLQCGVTPGVKSSHDTSTSIEYIDALREAAALNTEPLGKNDYETWQSECRGEYPSAEALISEFGSWKQACEAASVSTWGRDTA